MKIVYSVRDYVAPAGMERVLSNKANYFVNLGFEVSIIAVNHEESVSPFFYFDPRIKFYNLGIDEKDQKKLFNRKKYKKNIEAYVCQMSDLLNTIKPDISISMFIDSTSYLYKCTDGSKKVLELHFSKYKRKLKLIALQKYAFGRLLARIYSYKFHRILKHYDKFVILTEEDKESWGNLRNIAVIPNALSFYPDVQSDLSFKKVVAIGRLTSSKGFDLLIDIWKTISHKYPDWTLSIYGDESEKKKTILKNQIEDLKLKGKVEICPPKPIQDIFSDSSILTMTSLHEGFGMTLLEAMSFGLPVVAYACKCGPRDIISNGEDGFFVELGDKNAFIDKLSLLMGDEKLRLEMGQAARKNILRFSEEKIMQKWIDLFNQLISVDTSPKY